MYSIQLYSVKKPYYSFSVSYSLNFSPVWVSPRDSEHLRINVMLVYCKERVIVVIILFKGRNFIDVIKEVDLEVNTRKTKYILLSPHQNAGEK